MLAATHPCMCSPCFVESRKLCVPCLQDYYKASGTYSEAQASRKLLLLQHEVVEMPEQRQRPSPGNGTGLLAHGCLDSKGCAEVC